VQEEMHVTECHNAEDAELEEASSAPPPAPNCFLTTLSLKVNDSYDLLCSYVFGIVWQAFHIA